ncbi:MAG: alpha/beta hydrolase [Cyanobacteria bacterium P01_F01_bin.3]
MMNRVSYVIGIGFAALFCSNIDHVLAYSDADLQTHGLESSTHVIDGQQRGTYNQIADIAPWNQSPDDTAPYVLPPWGLTVNDFVVTRQVPLSTGKREVILNSPSTGSQQKFFISVPDSPSFQIYEMSFARVLAAGDGIEFEAASSQSLLNNFQIAFNSNEIATLTLADGTQAEFSEATAVIRSPNGQILENVQLNSNVVTSSAVGVPIGQKSNPGLAANQVIASPMRNQPLRLAQSQGICESSVRSHTSQLASSMVPWSDQLSQPHHSDAAKAIGWAIGHSAEALGNSLSLEDPIQNISCRPPVQCDERRVSGGSEIRTELFDIPQGSGGSEVALNYEFYTIPDSLEMYYDGNQIFSVGPSSGQGSKTFTLPASAQQVGVTIRGNDDPNTEWWFEVACSETTVPICNLNSIKEFITDNNTVSTYPDIKQGQKSAINACKKPLLVIYGGGGDSSWSHNVESWAESLIKKTPYSQIEGLTVKYFPFTDNFIPIGNNDEAVDFINQHIADNPNSPVVLVGHSYGGDTAYEAIKLINQKVDLLITLDPVSNFRPSQRSKPPNVSTWINVWTSHSNTGSDVIAEIGGDWDNQDSANDNIEISGIPHGASWTMYTHIQQRVVDTLTELLNHSQ